MDHHKRRRLLAAACGLLTVPLVSTAQKAGKTARVGWLGWTGGGGWSDSEGALEAFRSGLLDRGWQEGKNLIIDIRAGEFDRAPDLAKELLQSDVDVIVAQAGMLFRMRAVAGAIPIVFSISGDPVEAKLVASLSRPGGNLTGITTLSTELSGKRLQLLKETLPRLARVAAIANQSHPGVQAEYKAGQVAAQQLGLTLQWYPLYSVRDFDTAFDAIVRDGAEAIVAIPDTLVNQQAKLIADFAARRRMPAISCWAEFAEVGNLMSYGPTRRGFYRHVAVYVDKILRGARPADLPVEQPTVFEFVVNLKTAKTLGLSVPQSVLLRADRVIE